MPNRAAEAEAEAEAGAGAGAEATHRHTLLHLRPRHLRPPGYPAISKREMPYRLIAFTEQDVDMAALGFEPDTMGSAGTELIQPADPTIFLTAAAAAAGYTDRTDDIITANTLLLADFRNEDDAASLQEVRDGLQFLADTGYDLRHNPPN